MNLSMLPMGYTFSPTDEELLSFYLYHKIVGGFTPPIMLPVIDIYTEEPSQIWQQCGGVDGRDIYFFANLKKKKSRIVRKVGPNGATWSGESKATKVFSHNNTLVGSFKRFHYENPKMKKVDDHNNNCSWIMYEYTLQPDLVPKGVIHDSFVLCMLRKKILKQDKRALCTTKQTSFCPDLPNMTTATTQLNVHGDDPNPICRRVEEQICMDRVENECFVDMEQFGEQLLNGYDLEELSQLLSESDLQTLTTNYSGETAGETELKNQQYHVDVGLINECPTMQMKPWWKDITLHEICPTAEMKASDQNYSTEDEDTILFAKEIEMSLEQQ